MPKSLTFCFCFFWRSLAIFYIYKEIRSIKRGKTIKIICRLKNNVHFTLDLSDSYEFIMTKMTLTLFEVAPRFTHAKSHLMQASRIKPETYFSSYKKLSKTVYLFCKQAGKIANLYAKIDSKMFR